MDIPDQRMSPSLESNSCQGAAGRSYIPVKTPVMPPDRLPLSIVHGQEIAAPSLAAALSVVWTVQE